MVVWRVRVEAVDGVTGSYMKEVVVGRDKGPRSSLVLE